MIESPKLAVPPTGSRDRSIDALRVGALLVCVAMHAAVPYLSTPVPELLWAVQQAPGSWMADLIFWWGRCAQPQVFFLIAGVVSANLLDSRGPRAFVVARLRRIGVPLLSGIVFVLPVLGVVWAWGWLESGRVNWMEVRSWRFSDPAIAHNALGPAHLWFLEDLLIISVAFACWRRVTARGGPQRARLSGAMLLGLTLLGWTILLLRPDVLFVARNTFVPDIFRLAFDATFFAGGVSLATDRQAPQRWPHPVLLLGGAAVAAVMVIRLVGEGTAVEVRAIALPSAAIATSWLSVLGSLRLVAFSTPALPATFRRLAAATYPIYVLHLPIVGAAQVLLHPYSSGPVAAIAVVSVGSLALTWFLIEGATHVAARWQEVADRLRMVPVGVWTATAIVCGVGLRVVQYVRNPDVWHDEAAPLFLWIQRWTAVNISDSTWVMRLLPLVVSCAALVVFLPMTRVINHRMAPVAVLLMATSVKLIDHSVEAKPDTLDVLLAAATGSVFVLTRTWSVSRRATLFTLLAPLLVWTSYPGVFVLGGIVGALVIAARREEVRSRLAMAALVVVAGVSFALLFALPFRAQRSAEMLDTLQWGFRATTNPFSLAAWATRSAIGIVDYCFRPFGGILLIPIAAGLGALVRRGAHAIVVLLTLPLMLATAAGIAGQYSFSGSRVMVWVLPALAVLTAEGLGVMLSRIRGKATLLRATVVAIVVLPPIVLCAREMVSPSRRLETAAASSVVRAARRWGEVVVADHWEYRYYLRHIGDGLSAR